MAAAPGQGDQKQSPGERKKDNNKKSEGSLLLSSTAAQHRKAQEALRQSLVEEHDNVTYVGSLMEITEGPAGGRVVWPGEEQFSVGRLAPGDLTSVTYVAIWTLGVATYLPRADWVCFVVKDAVKAAKVPFERLLEVLGSQVATRQVRLADGNAVTYYRVPANWTADQFEAFTAA